MKFTNFQQRDKEGIQVTNIMNETGDVTKEPANMHRVYREYCEQFHSH